MAFRKTGLAALVLLGLFTASAAPATAQSLAVTGTSFEASSSCLKLADHFGALSAQALTTHIINLKDCQAYLAACDDAVKLNWSLSTLTLAGAQYTVKLQPPGGSCSSTSMDQTTPTPSTCVIVVPPTSFDGLPLNMTTTFQLSDLLGPNGCTPGSTGQALLYIIVQNGATTTGTANIQSWNVQFTIDYNAPKIPVLNDITPGGRNLKVSWTHETSNETGLKYKVYWQDTPIDPQHLDKAASMSVTTTNAQVNNLENGKTYYVVVASMDSNDNESDPSNMKSAVPVETQDLWQYYKANGGTSEGGYAICSARRTPPASDTAIAALLGAVLGGWLLARRRDARGGAWLLGVFALVTLAPSGAEAQYPSEQDASLELRFGYYRPGIDNEFSKTTGARPYGDLLGDSALSFGASYDRNMARFFGDLSVGFGSGYWSKSGTSRSVSGAASSDATSMTVIPINVSASYRFDHFALKKKFPLVPYAKLGLDYNLWWMKNGIGDRATYTDAKGATTTAEGGVAGWHGALGLRLLLDVFEPGAATSFDMEHGVNHSYLFGEWLYTNINNFGSKTSLDLSDSIFVFGVAFDL